MVVDVGGGSGTLELDEGVSEKIAVRETLHPLPSRNVVSWQVNLLLGIHDCGGGCSYSLCGNALPDQTLAFGLSLLQESESLRRQWQVKCGMRMRKVRVVVS